MYEEEPTRRPSAPSRARPDARTCLDVLLGLTRSLASEGALEEALQAVTDAALRILPGEHASIRLLDESGSELLCGARSGEGSDQRPVTFRPGEGLAGWVIEKGQGAKVDDVLADPRFQYKSGQGFQIRSMLALPLSAGEKAVGVLSVTSRGVSAFSDEDVALAQLLANCSVPPIVRARQQRLAVLDPHTLAFTQSHLMPRLGDEVERARKEIMPLSALSLKPDGFDDINVRHGREVGDLLLRVLASRVRANLRRRDVLVRRGGVEFFAILPETSTASAKFLADRLCLSIAERPLPIGGGRDVAQTVSVGVATWDGHEPAGRLEKRATGALQAARDAGTGRVVVV